MGGVFINYRRDETAGEARALYGELCALLGHDVVFMDVDNIALGRDFREVLHDRLESVDVMLALIGRDWLHVKSPSGQRRLDDPNDFVRREIRAALERNIAVTPVLLQGAQMPAELELPEDIRDLAFRNGFELSHARWASDVRELTKRLGLAHAGATEPLSPPTPSRTEQPAPSHAAATTKGAGRLTGVGISLFFLLAVAAAGGYVYYRHVESERAAQLIAQAESDRRKQQQEAERALAAALAASAAEAAAQRDREQQALAAAVAASQRALAELEAQRAREQSERERVARERANKERAAREQAAKEQAAKEQAAKEQAAKEQAAKEQAAKEQAAKAAKERRMAAIAKGKYTGSLAGALGDYAEWRGISLQEFTGRSAMPACGKWSEQVAAEHARTFRALCLSLPDYARERGLPLGRRPDTMVWTAYCESRADALNAGPAERSSFVRTCLRFR